MLLSRALPRLVAPFALLLAAACGPGGGGDAGAEAGGPLPNEGPFLAEAQGAVRRLVLTAEPAQAQAMLPARCELRAYLFNTTAPRNLMPLTTDSASNCRLYPATSNLALESQSWVCAGAIGVQYPGANENLVLCPSMGTRVMPSGVFNDALPCGGLTENAGVQLTSMSETPPDDAVTDLNATVNMPGAVTISSPASLGVATWPESGPLAVRWTGAGATSAVVTITARDAAASAPYIVCLPRTNGTLDVPADMILQANLRTLDVLVRVASYRDVDTTAEGAMTYRVSAGFASTVLLQARR